MTLPQNVATKYSAYLLFCRQLLEGLPELVNVARNDAQEDIAEEKYLKVFDERLLEFWNGRNYPDLQQAVQSFGGLLQTSIGVSVGQTHPIYQLFQRLISNALAQVNTWDYLREINQHHEQGRALAQKFFTICSPASFGEKLTRTAELELDYGNSSTDGDKPSIDLALGYRAAPIGTYHIKGNNGARKPKIIIRVSYDNDFKLYLCYPFLFLHEYTSHIFGNDFKNAKFNDGWMLFAASDFLNNDRLDAPDDHPLTLDQVEIFREHFYQSIGPICRKGFGTAFRLSSWLSKNSSSMSFQSITCELASFEPLSDEKGFWPTQFINALDRDLSENPRSLEEKMESFRDIRSLFSALPQ
ncbi:MAG TPA: hypothetical protein VGD61_09370 [Pyrinomonadaceae bacterium]